MQFVGSEDEEELDLIPEYCEWLCEQIYARINTDINRRKIQVRFNYLYKVSWLHWVNKRTLNVNSIMNTVRNSLIYEQHRKGIWRIKLNTNVLIPNTYTPMDRLFRFLEYGDNNIKAIGMIAKVRKHFNSQNLMSLWKLFSMENLDYMSEIRIITN